MRKDSGSWNYQLYRRLRGDLINVFKYVSDTYDVDTGFLPLAETDWTRGHSKKIRKSYARTDNRHYFFTQRVVDWWNELSEEVVDAPSVNAFKNCLDKHFSNHPVIYNHRALDNPVSPAHVSHVMQSGSSKEPTFLTKPKRMYVCTGMYVKNKNIKQGSAVI